jgi:hypothetical protein
MLFLDAVVIVNNAPQQWPSAEIGSSPTLVFLPRMARQPATPAASNPVL